MLSMSTDGIRAEDLEDFDVDSFSNTSGLTHDDLVTILGGKDFETDIKSEFAEYQREQQKLMQQNQQAAALAFHEVLQAQSASAFHGGIPPQFGTNVQFMGNTALQLQQNVMNKGQVQQIKPMQQPLFGTSSSSSFNQLNPQSPTSDAFIEPPAFESKPLYNPPNTLQPSQQLLNDVLKFQLEQKEKIERMFQSQKQLLAAPQQAAYNLLVNEQRVLKEQLESVLNSLLQVYKTVILEPPDLQRYYWLKQDLEIQLKQLELLIQELIQLTLPNAPQKCLASLVVLKQPFPFVISKNKQLSEEQLQVQLLTSANLRIQSISQVKAALLCDVSHGKGSSAKIIDADCQNLDPTTRIAKFPVKFLTGTKKAPAHFRFGMQVQLAGSTTASAVESNSTAPLVVMTNECQWEGCAGTLLKKEAFSTGQLEITWPEFANTLQHHFLRATKQELSRPRRILSPYDMRYIHQKCFGGKNIISQKDFDVFWDWFGKCLQKIRFQRHVCSMWINGLVYGFMGRDDVNAALRDQDPGTCIIRFSERHGGQFAIAYIGTERPLKIKHYLVQPTDTAASKKTLPDFLQECPQFSTMLVLTIENERPSFVKYPKAQALEQYCGKKSSKGSTENGYDPL